MQQNEDIELRLWEYIDGAGTAAERECVAALIGNDEVWKQTYAELMAFQGELDASLVPQAPSAAFTQGVMSTIAAPKPVPMRQYINNSLMRGIAAIFIVCIGITLLTVLLTADWAAPATRIAMHMPTIEWGNMLNGTVTNSAMGVMVILGLFFLDNTLRVRRLRHQ